MRKDELTYEDLLEIVELIKSSSEFSEFHLKVGDIEVSLRRKGAPRPVAAALPLQPEATAHAQRTRHLGGGELAIEPAPVVPAPATRREADSAWPEGAVLVRSPMVGTFYRAPEPGAPAFVEVGQRVDASTTVCIIEVMKLMNSISASASGVVTHILVADAEPVEYGQVLMVIQPH